MMLLNSTCVPSRLWVKTHLSRHSNLISLNGRSPAKDPRRFPIIRNFWTFWISGLNLVQTLRNRTTWESNFREMETENKSPHSQQIFLSPVPVVLCAKQKNTLCMPVLSLRPGKMFATVKTNNLCLNCLRPGHMSKNCKSNNHCRKCQRLHHTLLHMETSNPPAEEQANTAVETSNHTLLMTCQVLIHAPDGSSIRSIRARGILDSGSAWESGSIIATASLYSKHPHFWYRS